MRKISYDCRKRVADSRLRIKGENIILIIQEGLFQKKTARKFNNQLEEKRNQYLMKKKI